MKKEIFGKKKKSVLPKEEIDQQAEKKKKFNTVNKRKTSKTMCFHVSQ